MSAREFIPERPTLSRMRAAAVGCRGCELWRDATQTVFGEGPAGARIVLVGEMAGDREDRAGRPFVGPAGRELDRALETAEIRSPRRLRDECRQALQVRGARQAPHPPDAQKG